MKAMLKSVLYQDKNTVLKMEKMLIKQGFRTEIKKSIANGITFYQLCAEKE